VNHITSTQDVAAQSPSFVRQEIVDDTLNDWLVWKGSSSPLSNSSNITTHSGVVSELNTVQDISECRTLNNSFFSPDIESVSYISDGNTLNATVWLTDPFEEPSLSDRLDTFQENLKLSASKTNLSLEDYTNVKKGRIFDPLGESTIVENSTFISGYPAYELVYDSKDSDESFNTDVNTLKVMQVWTIIDGNAYDFTYSAVEEKYSEFLPIIKQMIKSFTRESNGIDNNDENNSLLSSNQSMRQLADHSVYKGNGISIDYPKDWLVEDKDRSEELSVIIFSSPFEDEQLDEPSWREITYTLAVDIDSVHDAGTDYRVKILRTPNDNNNGQPSMESWNWTKQVQEVSAYDKIRVLEQAKNFTSFYKTGDPYILFSFDLNSVNAPRQYKAVFYITDYYVINHRLCRLIDTTNWVIIPPPDFDISIKPTSSIVLRPNEERTVQLQIKGNSDLQSEAVLTTTTPDGSNTSITPVSGKNMNNSDKSQGYGNDDISLQFTPEKVPVPPSGVGTSTVYIKALENATAKLYTFPITTNISFPTSIMNRGGEIFNNSRSVNVMESANLTLTVLPPYTFDEQMNNFVTAWITPISGVWSFIAGVGAVVVPLFLYFYRKRQKSEYKEEQKQGNQYPKR
jgi:hypothetical protein